jgi:hypothetical protein
MDHAAETYVKLVLAMGEHDRDYVDAYYGPPEWRAAIQAEKPSLDEIRRGAAALVERLRATPEPSDPMLALRRQFLMRQTEALMARIGIVEGKRMSFDEESKALYDSIAPHHPEEHFQNLLGELERELPGSGSLSQRLDAFRNQFAIPRASLDAVFQKAIAGCRSATLQRIDLPSHESFTVEYVTNKTWSGYNWYQGNYRSLIQVNTDLPIYIDRAIDLACHEGYPGHHVYNSLLEKSLVRDRGWIELTVYPLFSPQSLIAEGSANYGIEVTFPGDERIEWEKANLFPLAGLDASRAVKYYRIHSLGDRLSYAGNEAARGYLDGQIDAARAAEWLEKYALMSPARAQQRVRFIDQYRSYVINYNLGKDLVRAWVERRANGNRDARWRLFEQLLSSPMLPAALR